MFRHLTLYTLALLTSLITVEKAEGQRANPKPKNPSPSLRFTVPPETLSAIEVQTIPHSICKLYPGYGRDRSIQTLKLYADQKGVVRFFVRSAKESDSITHFTLECRGGGRFDSYPIDLRASSVPTTDMPAPTKLEATMPRGRRLPALSKKEALRLSDEQLLKRGYPPRPDSDKAPQSFAAWLRAVSNPQIIITPHTVVNPQIRHDYATVQNGTEGSGNWSGYELRSNADSYGWVSGEWIVPSVTGEAKSSSYSATWVGLDGDGSTDLVQAGTEQDAIVIGTMSGTMTVATYRAWTEFLPQQPSESVITDFAVSPGDTIFAEVFVASAGKKPDLNGYFGQFVLTKFSKNNNGTTFYEWIYTPRGTTVVGGTEAEWIMERPTLTSSTGTQSLAELADYGSAAILSAYASTPIKDKHRNYVLCCGTSSIQITMTNGTDTLSNAAAPDGQSMNFTWKAFH